MFKCRKPIFKIFKRSIIKFFRRVKVIIWEDCNMFIINE